MTHNTKTHTTHTCYLKNNAFIYVGAQARHFADNGSIRLGQRANGPLHGSTNEHRGCGRLRHVHTDKPAVQEVSDKNHLTIFRDAFFSHFPSPHHSSCFRRFEEKRVMLWGGFFFMVVGRVIMIPWGTEPPLVAELGRKNKKKIYLCHLCCQRRCCTRKVCHGK